jgi:hypothetical protein
MSDVEELFRQHPSFGAGEAIAEKDVSSGRLGYRSHGKHVPWWPDIAKILQERYRITFDVVGHCITDMAVAAEAAGYNARMDAEFLSRFGGVDIIESVTREVERKRKKRG